MATKIFICHTKRDIKYVEELASQLEKEGCVCWYYERDNHGQSVGTAVDRALIDSDAMVFVMSRNLPVATQYIQNELNTFVESKKKIIPIRVKMSDGWRPNGSRSLIQAYPVVDDRTGNVALIVDEIVRVVNNEGEPQRANAPMADRGILSPQRKRIRMLLTALAVVLLSLTGIFWHMYVNKKTATTSFAPGSAKTILIDDIKIVMKWCPAGEFLMGSPLTEDGRRSDEVLHKVRLSRGFWMGETPVTQGLWRRVMKDNPSWFKKTKDKLDNTWDTKPLREALRSCPAADFSNHPIESISWHDATNFIAKLNAMTGCGFRLPTEAEWEYACRSGSREPFSFGRALNGDLANCNGEEPYGTEIIGPYLHMTTEVGRYEANGFGLYDMHGNVNEWTQDFYGEYRVEDPTDPMGPTYGTTKVVRGGAWWNSAACARSARRIEMTPGTKNSRTGMRLCMSSKDD